MAETKATKAETAATPITTNNDQLAQALVAALQTSQEGLAAAIVKATTAVAPPRQLTVDEVDRITPFNPTGKRNRQLPCLVFQNGVRLNVSTCHDEEIALIGQLQPGKFVNGLVTIVEREVGGSKVLHINHDGATQSQRIALKSEVRNLTELLKRCVAEAKGQGQ